MTHLRLDLRFLDEFLHDGGRHNKIHSLHFLSALFISATERGKAYRLTLVVEYRPTAVAVRNGHIRLQNLPTSKHVLLRAHDSSCQCRFCNGLLRDQRMKSRHTGITKR